MASSSSSSSSTKKGDRHQKGREQQEQSAGSGSSNNSNSSSVSNLILRNDAEGKFLLNLNIMLSMENAALERLHARIQETPIPEAKEALVRHLEETRQQKDRLRTLIRDVGRTTQGQQPRAALSAPTDERAGLPQYLLPEIMADALSKSLTPIEQELKTIEIDGMIESAEIMAYNSLVQMALKMGFGEAAVALRQSLEEEERMAARISASSPAIFGKYWTPAGDLLAAARAGGEGGEEAWSQQQQQQPAAA